MMRSLLVLLIAALLLLPASASAHRHHKLSAKDICLLSERNQWIEEYSPGGESYCEHIGRHKQHPITIEFTVAV